MKAFDPIVYEDININEWLNLEDDNIIVILNYKQEDKNIYLALKKSYLFATTLNETYVNCKFTYDSAFLPKESYTNKKTYFNLGYYINKKILIENKKTAGLLDKNKFFYVILDDEKEPFIKKEYIALSFIGLYDEIKSLKKRDMSIDTKKRNVENATKINKKNIPHKIDVYFEKILAQALQNYSYQWDVPINSYLRLGEQYFTEPRYKFQNFAYRFGKTKELAVEAIKNKIVDLDRAFLEAGTIHEDTKQIYWRGMREPIAISEVGQTITIPNFFSISEKWGIAYQFSSMMRKRCCIYKLIIDKGVPVINMVNTTKFKIEKEILLPRNLNYTIRAIDPIPYGKFDNIKTASYIITLQVSLARSDQFKLQSNCKDYNYGIIKALTDKTLIKELLENKDEIKQSEPKQTKKVESTKVQPKQTKKVEPKKVQPKQTKKVEPKKVSPKQTKTKKVEPTQTTTKKPRCPNGSRRSLTTGNCEKKAVEKYYSAVEY